MATLESNAMIGRTVADAEARNADRTRIGVATLKRPEAEVEGQAWRYRRAVCPAGDTVWLWYDTLNYRYYTCGVCGMLFYV